MIKSGKISSIFKKFDFLYIFRTIQNQRDKIWKLKWELIKYEHVQIVDEDVIEAENFKIEKQIKSLLRYLILQKSIYGLKIISFIGRWNL